jgi:hypothetical protein
VVAIVLLLGVFYIWFMVGLSPLVQVRDGGLGIVVGWLLGGLFAAFHLAAAFFLERNGPWGIAGITLCLLILWIVGIRRNRIFRHVFLKRRDNRRSAGEL